MDIKMRAWHTEFKQMIEWDDIKQYHSMHFIFDYGTLDRMLYTGQKDKNNREICLYDIIKIAEKITEIVLWDNEKSSFYVEQIEDNECKSEHLFGIHMAEVIGDKYRNPELLK